MIICIIRKDVGSYTIRTIIEAPITWEFSVMDGLEPHQQVHVIANNHPLQWEKEEINSLAELWGEVRFDAQFKDRECKDRLISWSLCTMDVSAKFKENTFQDIMLMRTGPKETQIAMALAGVEENNCMSYLDVIYKLTDKQSYTLQHISH